MIVTLTMGDEPFRFHELCLTEKKLKNMRFFIQLKKTRPNVWPYPSEPKANYSCQHIHASPEFYGNIDYIMKNCLLLLRSAFFNFSFTTISNKFLMQEEGIHFKIKLIFSIFFTCFIEKVRHFVLLGKINIPSKIKNSRHFNFMSGQFSQGRRGRKMKNKKMLAL